MPQHSEPITPNQKAVDFFVRRWGNDDLVKKLVGRPGATTPWPEKPENQQEAEEKLLQRQVDLNHQRTAEEAQGKIRWLRPEYQAPEEAGEQGKLETSSPDGSTNQPTKRPTDKTTKIPWPKTLKGQIRTVREQLTVTPMDATTMAAHYKRKPETYVTKVLEAMTELGMVKRQESGIYRLGSN